MNLSTRERQQEVSDILKWVGGVVLGLLLLGAVVLGGWQIGWWFKEQNVERQSHIFRESYANQERLREDAAEKIAEVLSIEVQIGELGRSDEAQAGQLHAQAEAITAIACHDISQVSESPEAELEAFAASRCAAQ
jgi:hypothetical protein